VVELKEDTEECGGIGAYNGGAPGGAFGGGGGCETGNEDSSIGSVGNGANGDVSSSPNGLVELLPVARP